jgi:hypothetical protein
MNDIGVTHTNLYEWASGNEGDIVDAKVNPSLLGRQPTARSWGSLHCEDALVSI